MCDNHRQRKTTSKFEIGGTRQGSVSLTTFKDTVQSFKYTYLNYINKSLTKPQYHFESILFQQLAKNKGTKTSGSLQYNVL